MGALFSKNIRRTGHREILFLVFGFLLSAASPCGAQSADPDSFFSGDYVRKPLQRTGKQKRSPSRRELSSPKELLSSEDKKAPEKEDGFRTPIFNEKRDAEKVLEGEHEEEEKTIAMEALALVINASDADTSFAQIRRYADLLVQFDITPEAVYTMQIPQFIVRDAPLDWVKVITRGGKIQMKRSLIEQYGLEKVPTWIARTSEGDVILEGYEDITPFLTQKGEIRRKLLKAEGEKLKEVFEEELSTKTPLDLSGKEALIQEKVTEMQKAIEVQMQEKPDES
ncbi:hypothetical protein MRY87_08265 [bacterium]|nr:hypothetical protein [bacterium]